jgi:transposase-like protein
MPLTASPPGCRLDPTAQFCHNPACPACGQRGQGNIRVHSRAERRYRCQTCGQTFAATTGTPFYRLRTAADLVTLVVTLLAHGCPVQAVVAAFGVDERTVAAWRQRAGTHCRQVHAHLVQGGHLELGHVQADEVWVKAVGRKVWMAMALAVPSRLWLGGVLSPHRDGALIAALVRQVVACTRAVWGMGSTVLVCVDGLASYGTAFRRAFRVPVPTGRRGRPRLALPAGFLLGQAVKRYTAGGARAARRVVGVAHRVVCGTAAAISAALVATRGGTVINTAYIERLNATFRQHLAPLARRGRALARTEAALTAGMWLVGCAYNFCWVHEGLRQRAGPGAGKWLERTPAMAAGLTDRRWALADLLHFRVPRPAAGTPKAPRRRGRPPRPPKPPPPPAAPKRRGRPPKRFAIVPPRPAGSPAPAPPPGPASRPTAA